ncbi:hypothetical protein DYB32_000534 [Aphanomyces invadans]|uniref:Uncharacterized protein n=1 Tax=Aphanomyces invadans TaxID=157072 RepID=A0A3R6WTT0_9STRA|nr:hypothetical protein DYB32_000534 [Aphanomyces invadans]
MRVSPVAIAVVATSAAALQCTTSQINVVVSAAQGSANSIPCTQVAGFSISEFISSPTLTPTESQLAKANANPNCVALIKELQGLTITANCEWWNVPLKTLLQLDFKGWVVAKVQAIGDLPTTTPAATTATTPTTTAPEDDDEITTKTPTTTSAKTTTKVTTPRPTTIANNTNTSVPTTDVITTEAPFPTDELTEEPTTKKPTTRAPTTTVPSSAIPVVYSIAAVAFAAAATMI